MSDDFHIIHTGLTATETLSEVSTFRARHTAAATRNASLRSSAPQLDLAKYKSVLKDQSALQNAEKVLSSFKPVSYDLGKIQGVVDAFESRAVEQAKATVEKISAEEDSLNATLSNIKDARPFEDLTVDEVGSAQPQITQAVETMIKKGKWTVPGYRVSTSLTLLCMSGRITLIFGSYDYRRSLVTSA